MPLLGVLCALWTVSTAWGGAVEPDMALRVARGQVRHHVAIFGDWNGAASPQVSDNHETISLEQGPSAYHFPVHPTGYVIVAAYDTLSPVPFYSTRSAFDIRRADHPTALEAWMVSLLKAKSLAALDHTVQKAATPKVANLADNTGSIQSAWDYYHRLGNGQSGPIRGRSLFSTTSDDSVKIIRGANLKPLLTTVWGQDAPYNIDSPNDGCKSGHALTGCVATAWAQVLNYWQWPLQSVGGQGEHAYTWRGATTTRRLSAEFSNTEAYQWDLMPEDLAAPGTTDDQKNAVSKLIYYISVSSEMDFGCPETPPGSASELFADEVLDIYFRFKQMSADANRLSLSNYTAQQWFNIILKELDHDPPRPIIFSIGSPSGWHEVVIDGYQSGPGQKVHINFGWDGNFDAYYDISDDADFNIPGYDWDVKQHQIIVIGIEPDNKPPVVKAGADVTAEEETDVQLSVVSATDPEGMEVVRYRWHQIEGPAATIANAASPSPTVTIPDVHDLSDLVFEVKAYDANRGVGTDTCTVTVNNTDKSVAPPSSSGGGGGCFLRSLFN